MTDDTNENNKPDLKVVPLNVPQAGTTDDIDVDTILEAAKGELKCSLIVGFTHENQLYLAMSQGSIAENLFLLESARLALNSYMLGD